MNRIVLLLLTVGALGWASCTADMGDFDVSLTGGYRLEHESAHAIDVYHEHTGKDMGIPAKVVEIAWNERFVLAKQQELQPRGDFPGDTYPVPVPGKFNYWIIDVGLTNRYGPMPETEFTKTLEKLGQTRLKLQNVYKARKLASRAN